MNPEVAEMDYADASLGERKNSELCSDLPGNFEIRFNNGKSYFLTSQYGKELLAWAINQYSERLDFLSNDQNNRQFSQKDADEIVRGLAIYHPSFCPTGDKSSLARSASYDMIIFPEKRFVAYNGIRPFFTPELDVLLENGLNIARRKFAETADSLIFKHQYGMREFTNVRAVEESGQVLRE